MDRIGNSSSTTCQRVGDGNASISDNYPMRILVTGASGYIGSHTCLALLGAGHEIVGLDNFCNSSPESLRRVGQIAGQPVELVEADIRDSGKLAEIFGRERFDAVMHFAGLKAVGESTREPTRYFDNNVTGTRKLVEAMQSSGVKRLIFSSSATVYSQQAADRKSTRLNSSHIQKSRMPSSA